MTKKKTNNNLLEGSLFKSILRLSYPIALGSVAQTLYNLADAFWLGKLGKEALSAPIISFFILFCVISLALGFSAAGTALVSQYTGAGQKEKTSTVTGNLLFYLMIFSVVFGGLGLIFDRELLTLLRTPTDTFEMTLSYYRIMMAGMPLAFPIFVYQSVMTGYGDTMSPLKITFVTAVLNVILDPILIFGWLGAPALGIEGAALASVFTRGLASVMGIYLFFSEKKGIVVKLRHLKPDFKLLPLVFKIGVPAAVGSSGTSLGFMVLIGFVNMFGTEVVSAYGIGMRAIHVFMLPALGISSAVSAIVGQNLGAGNPERAKEAVKKGIILMLSFIGPATLLVAFLGKQVTMFFIPGDPVIHEIGRVLFYITAPSLVLYGLSSVLEGAFQGAGYNVPVMIANLARLWLFRIPFVYVVSFVILDGPANLDASVGIWWGITFSTLCALVIVWLWYLKGSWARPRIDTGNSPERGNGEPELNGPQS